MRFDPLACDAADFDQRIETLRFRHHKWDAFLSGKLRVLPEALLLSPGEHQDLVATAEAVAGALQRAAGRLRGNPDVLDRLGIPRPVRPLLEADPDRGPQLARYDLIPTDQGWMIPEFNEDAPGGFNEAVAARPVFGPVLARGEVAGDFAASFLAGRPPGKRCGLVYASGYAEDLQHVLVLADLLRGVGVEPVLGAADQLVCRPFGKPRLQGVALDWIFRFFPGEWYAFLPSLRAWQRAAARVPLMNPFGRLVEQSKALYALWREPGAIDPADRAVLDRHTPDTRLFSPALVEAMVEAREDWVLKGLYGRMGDAVVIGRRTPAEIWRKELELAARKPEGYIAQRAFVPHGLPSRDAGIQHPALGVYLVNGRFGGYYSRADEHGFTTHEANYVVTAVKTA